MIMLTVCLMAVNAPAKPNLLSQTFRACSMVESHGDPLAINARENAVGIVQIRPIMVRECNRIVGRERWTLRDRTDSVKSYAMFVVYCQFYAARGTPETWARIWNGGPMGATKQSTVIYWEKVRKYL